MLRHLATPAWRRRQLLPAASLARIEQAIGTTERQHRGEIRFAVETALDVVPLWRGVSARERAIEVFANLRVWDTEENNGVLIYLLLADHDVEIVADRGIHARVGADGWEKICRAMEARFRAGHFEQGVREGIAAVSAALVRHFPGPDRRGDELPDKPVLL
jgi:uncharacterized membrane protein